VRVVVTDQVFGGIELERSLLEPLGAEVVEAPDKDEETLTELAGTADAILVCYANVSTPVVEAAAGAGCKIIARYGIGFDNIDVATARAAGITVTNVPDYCLDEVADHAMALLLSLLRGVPRAAASVRAGDWAVPQAGIRRLRGRRLALLGVGRIGSRVVERSLPFGLEVVGYDPYLPTPIPGLRIVGSIEEAVRDADAISVHAPLTPETANLIGPATIAQMERSPVIVNTSRGGLVDLDAAMAALEDGSISGLGLDVTVPEPLPPSHPLRNHPAVIITPHIAFYSEEAQLQLQRSAADEVVRALTGQPPRCPVRA
jgi:D-3-phosphoglycerate dehydrogenase